MSLSTRTILSNFARPQISPEIISALITMLQELEPENIKLLGADQVLNLQTDHFSRKILDNFTFLGGLSFKTIPGFKAAINKFLSFKSTLPLHEQKQLDDTDIQLPTLLGYTRIEKFGDICFNQSRNRTPEQSCLFTSQIFLWQLVVNAGTVVPVQIPEVVQLLANVWFCDIKTLTHIESVTASFEQNCQSSPMLIPNVSHNDQLQGFHSRNGFNNKSTNNIQFTHFKKGGKGSTQMHTVRSSPNGLSSIIELEDDVRDLKLSCKV